MYEGSKAIIPCCYNPEDCLSDESPSSSSFSPSASFSSSSSSKRMKNVDQIFNHKVNQNIPQGQRIKSINNDTMTFNGSSNDLDEVALVFWFKGLSGSPLFTLDFSNRIPSSSRSGSTSSSEISGSYRIKSSTTGSNSRISIENSPPPIHMYQSSNDGTYQSSSDRSSSGKKKSWIIPSLAINPVTLEDVSEYR